MRIAAIGALWFLAAWFCFDFTCYVLGLPRQLTPLVATASGVLVAVGRGMGRNRPITDRMRVRVGEVQAR